MYYYYFELFCGCLCYRNNNGQYYGPEITYSIVINRSSQNVSWNSFSIAKNNCLSSLKHELNTLLSSNQNTQKEIKIIHKLIERLTLLNEQIVKAYCDNMKIDEMPV